ncbi:hypothetical protein BJ742DRAFT_742042 [Cladochytrium replicatum]|nr:hypothetical protein BJ742DRAFT_742042 [Cladochytrium replicatum]
MGELVYQAFLDIKEHTKCQEVECRLRFLRVLQTAFDGQRASCTVPGVYGQKLNTVFYADEFLTWATSQETLQEMLDFLCRAQRNALFPLEFRLGILPPAAVSDTLDLGQNIFSEPFSRSQRAPTAGLHLLSGLPMLSFLAQWLHAKATARFHDAGPTCVFHKVIRHKAAVNTVAPTLYRPLEDNDVDESHWSSQINPRDLPRAGSRCPARRTKMSRMHPLADDAVRGSDSVLCGEWKALLVYEHLKHLQATGGVLAQLITPNQGGTQRLHVRAPIVFRKQRCRLILWRLGVLLPAATMPSVR